MLPCCSVIAGSKCSLFTEQRFCCACLAFVVKTQHVKTQQTTSSCRVRRLGSGRATEAPFLHPSGSHLHDRPRDAQFCRCTFRENEADVICVYWLYGAAHQIRWSAPTATHRLQYCAAWPLKLQPRLPLKCIYWFSGLFHVY